MTRVLFCVVPEKGHLNPCIGPAQHLQAAGLDVAFYAPADISEQLAGAGNFVFLGPREKPERHDLSRGASFATNIRDRAWLRAWIRGLLVDAAPLLVDAIRDVIRQWQPAVVVIDPLLYASAIAAELEGVPWVSLSNSLNPVLPDHLDSELLRTVQELAPSRDRLFADYGIQAGFRGCDVLSPYLTVAFATEALVGQAPPGVSLVGPALPLAARGDEQEFPWERLDDTLALVYMSLGSQLYFQPEVFNKVIAAARDLPVQLVLSIGELHGTGLVRATDGRVITARYAPQLAILRRAHAFITHGGANSVMEAAACGVPLLLSPMCNDQFHCAHFVEQAHVGCRLDLHLASEADIRSALEVLLSPGAIRDNAALLARSYQRDGSANAAGLIRQLVAKTHPATRS